MHSFLALGGDGLVVHVDELRALDLFRWDGVLICFQVFSGILFWMLFNFFCDLF